MRLHQLVVGITVAVLGTWWTVGGLRDPVAGQERPAGRDDLEVLTRGPVHEAFAEPVVFDAEPGLIVSRKPPAPIEEMPPDQKPEGDHVAWVGGYWAWADDRNDFIWVSGIWRDIPPGRQWTPGYWREVEDGHQWISGFWASASAQEVDYLPTPPDSLEVGPSSQAPSANHIWVPGCWTWYETRYLWRTGYWIVAQPGWIWCPAYYAWTPSGCVFVDGYWDYSFRRRGLLFAPVYFAQAVYARPAYVYAPTIVIDVDLITDHFFCRPRYHHYYFGDYYAATYFQAGFYPWFSFHQSRYGYDPVYAYYNWHYSRSNPDWEDQVYANYKHRREHEEARPPVNLAAQQKLITNAKNKVAIENLALARPLAEVAANKEAGLKLERLDDQRRKEATRHFKDLQEAREQRVKLEKDAAAKGPIAQPKQDKPLKLNLPKSPVVSKPDKVKSPDADKLRTPPAPPTVPKADPNVKPRKPDEARPRPEPRLDPKPPKPKDADLPAKPKDATKPKDADAKPKDATPRPPKDAKPQPKDNHPPKPQPKPMDIKPQPKPKENPTPQPPKDVKPQRKPKDIDPKSQPKPDPDKKDDPSKKKKDKDGQPME